VIALLEVVDDEGVIRFSVQCGPSLSWRASRVTAGCEAQRKAEGLPFHPGVTGEGKAGRVNASESSYAPLSAAPQVGGSSGV
jgi:hypothetical protein